MPSLWTLENSVSHLHSANINLQVTTSAGDLCLEMSPVETAPDDTENTSVSPTFRVACSANWETYHRGHDYVAINDSVDDQLRTLVYFREVEGMPGVELIASRQTSLLDKNGELEVTTEISSVRSIKRFSSLESGSLQEVSLTKSLQDQKIDVASTSALLLEASDCYSIAIIIYPGDAKEIKVSIDSQNRATLSTILLGEHLEKGVIRQARMQAVMLETSAADSLISDAYLAFVNSEAVLST
ncbi:MAG: hypothetical protein ACKVH8_19360 [Pirellulales bacterium]